MVVESAIPELAKRPVGVDNAMLEPAKRRLLVEGVGPVQQNDPKLLQMHLRCSADTPVQQKDAKLLQVHLRCSANKAIVDGIDGRTLGLF